MFGTAMDAVKFLDSIEFEILLFCAFCGEIDFTELTVKKQKTTITNIKKKKMNIRRKIYTSSKNFDDIKGY